MEADHWIAFAATSLYIVTILDVVSEIFVDDDQVSWVVHGISSEYAELGDLHEAIKNDKLRSLIKTEADFVQFLLNVISGVRAGHEAQICHCDIKPKNILLFWEGATVVPKLLDFGVSSSVLEPARGHTPGYVAPELAAAGSSATPLSDIYSLGMTFYDILCGTLLDPTDSMSVAQLKPSRDAKSLRILLEETTVQTDLTVPYRRLIASMLHEKPEERPTLSQITSILESTFRALISQGPQHTVKTPRDTYLWNPALHELLEERLFYIFVKGGNPNLDLRDIITDLNHAGARGFSLRSVTGAWDYVVRIWASRTHAGVDEVRSAIARNGRTLIALEVVSHQLTHAQPKKIVRADSEMEMLRQIEACASDGGFEKLRKNGYVGGKLNHSPKVFRVTLLVEVPRNFWQVAPFVGTVIAKEIQKDSKAREISYYDVKTVGDQHSDVRLVVKFMHSNFVVCRTTLLRAFESVVPFGNNFRFSTLLDVCANEDRLSDDGMILERIQAACSGKL